MSRRPLPHPHSGRGTGEAPYSIVYSNSNPQPSSLVPIQGYGQHAQYQYQQTASSYQYPDPELYELRRGGFYYPVAPPPSTPQNREANTASLQFQSQPEFAPHSQRGLRRYGLAPQSGQQAYHQQALAGLPAQATFDRPLYQNSTLPPQAPQGPVVMADLPRGLLPRNHKPPSPAPYQSPAPTASYHQTMSTPQTLQAPMPALTASPCCDSSSPENRKPGGDSKVPTWPQYPTIREDDCLPPGLSLFQIASQYPNHLIDQYLDDFMRARWTAGEIQACMPAHCRKDLNKRDAQDKTMWIQKRLQKREQVLQASQDCWKNLWESPQPRADGRPAHIKGKASLFTPKQGWLDKRGLHYQAPAGMDSRELPGTSYFQLDPSWKAKKSRHPRPYSTGNTGNDAVATSRADRRRTAPANIRQDNDEDDSSAFNTDMSDQSPDQSQSSSPSVHRARDSNTPSDIDADADEDDQPRKKLKLTMKGPTTTKVKSVMRRAPLEYAALDADAAVDFGEAQASRTDILRIVRNRSDTNHDDVQTQDSGNADDTIVVASPARGRLQTLASEIEDDKEEDEGKSQKLRSARKRKR